MMVSDPLHRSGRDALTGALDRSSLRQWVESELPRSLAAGRSLALLYLDYDDFHLVNDRFGQALGDVVLARWVALLSSALGPDDLVARVAGNELVLIIDRERAPDLELLLCTMRRAVRAGITLPDLAAEFSAGIVPIAQAIGFDALLVEGVVRMVRGRESWRALFGAPSRVGPAHLDDPAALPPRARATQAASVERASRSRRVGALH